MLEHEVIIMKKLFKVVTFTVFPDGSYRQEYGNGAHSAMMFDFADLFITLSANGWRMK